MGVADRDYMHSRRQDEHFTKHSEPSGTSTLKIVLFWLVIAFACYKAVTWWQQQRQAPKPVAAKPVPQQPTVTQPRTDARLTGNWDPAFAPAAPSQRSQPREQSRQVTKCTVNGSTTYSDGPCPVDAKAATVKIDRSQNIADSVRIAQAPLQPPPQQPPQQIAQAEQPLAQAESPHLLKKQRCEYLDEQIKRIDARARQPLSAGEQDWLAARRKEHRDEQFRIRC